MVDHAPRRNEPKQRKKLKERERKKSKEKQLISISRGWYILFEDEKEEQLFFIDDMRYENQLLLA